jgi:hypothetical protein
MGLLDYSYVDGWYRITTNFACGAIVIKNGWVVMTAPIFSWMNNKIASEAFSWGRITSVEYLGE